MLSIGWVVFWKSVVVAVWIAIVAQWAAFRKRRAEKGLPLTLDKRTGVYVVKDWPDRVERVFRFGRNAVYAYTFFLWTLIAIVIVFGLQDEARAVLWRIMAM